MSTSLRHKGPSRQYNTMTLAAILQMNVADLVESDAHLYLWTTNTFLREAHDVSQAWGFEPRSILTWVKPGIGTGPFFRSNTEHVVFGVRGRLALESRSEPTAFSWPRGRHSEKPDAFYDLVERVSPGPYAELFSRRARFGWDYPIGNQALGGVVA